MGRSKKGFSASHKSRAACAVKRIARQNNFSGKGKAVKVFSQLVRFGVIDWQGTSREALWAWFDTVKHLHPSRKQKARQKKKGVNTTTASFYDSREWRELRYAALKKHGRRCLCCGASPEDGVTVLHVDHIKPRSLYPDLALDADNLQVLCADCNIGKCNYDTIDYRMTSEKRLAENQRQLEQALADEARLAYELSRRIQ